MLSQHAQPAYPVSMLSRHAIEHAIEHDRPARPLGMLDGMLGFSPSMPSMP
jgi:hypothetical protein